VTRPWCSFVVADIEVWWRPISWPNTAMSFIQWMGECKAGANCIRKHRRLRKGGTQMRPVPPFIHQAQESLRREKKGTSTLLRNFSTATWDVDCADLALKSAGEPDYWFERGSGKPLRLQTRFTKPDYEFSRKRSSGNLRWNSSILSVSTISPSQIMTCNLLAVFFVLRTKE
jgi:hypothetical protein